MNRYDLTQGSILKTLLRLALPIMGTQFMHMMYNLTDMFWLGRLSSDAVASSGTAGLFIWLSVGFMLIGRVGAEIGVSQARGRGDMNEAFRYSRKALYMAALLGVLFAAPLFLFRHTWVGFFNFQEANVAADTALYLGIISISIPFTFISAAINGIFTASGNSRTPFIFNTIGLLINISIDPIFIFVLGMGVGGAAWASVIAQTIVVIALITALKKGKNRPFGSFTIFNLKELTVGLCKGETKQIIKWTLPVCLESTFFCVLTMITASFVISFGAHALAVSQVGSQIESLSWLIGGGFGAALTTFVGQNYGADKPERIKKGVRQSAYLMAGWGLIVSCILFFGGGIIFDFFLPDPALRHMGVLYGRVLALCQIAMNLEAVAANAFRGIGRTVPPSVTSIVSNIIRVPLAYFLAQTSLGLTGIWVAISATAGMKGILICGWYWMAERKDKSFLKAISTQV